VLNCMQAAGYRLVGKCASGTAGYTYRSCYEWDDSLHHGPSKR